MSRPSLAREERQREREQMKRERDVLLLYGSAFANIPYIEHVPKHCPRLAPDAVLTALCKLAAIRLNAERCMVSLLDEESGRQHWLSEATRDLALRPEMPGDAPETLWLGNVSTPRSWGLCKELLSLSPEDEPVFSIDDLTKDGRSTFRDHIKGIPEMHFFASTALKSPNGCIVGSMCVFDSKSRDGLTKEEVVLLRGLAATVMDHLHTYTVQDCYRRGERFTRGLVSFAEGAAVISPLDTGSNIDPTQKDATNVVHLQSTSAPSPPRPDASKLAMPSVDTSIAASPEGTAKPTSPPTSPVSKTRSESVRNQAIGKLQNKILPMNAKSMFSRAASIMMASSDLDGVLILDASVAANYQRHGPWGFANGTDTPYESDMSKMPSSDSASGTDGIASNCASSRSSSKKCQVLGMATSDRTGEVQLADILEADLGRLLQEFPNGKIITFTTNGLSLSSNDDSSDLSGANGVKPSQSGEPPKRTASQKSLRGSKAVQAMFPGARCVAFVPFWDYERSRWFAGCLCWSNNIRRLLSPAVDLAYLKIFSHSIMRELSRLDARASNMHGILGALEFIKDTPLDIFQTSMLNSLNACGTTLLDTINHVMDYAKLGEARQSISSKRLLDGNTIRLSSKPLKIRRNKAPAFDLSIATEEVVEAVFSGSTYVPVTSKLLDAAETPTFEASDPMPQRKSCFIVLDLAFEDDWVFAFPVGSWRRLVMNLFGNAVKYTSSGFVHVSLRVSRGAENSSAATSVTLTIKDTGAGISPTFLVNGAFQAFSQEDTHAVGTGLGLSIVKQIIDINGGNVDIRSELAVGTEVTVKVALPKPDRSITGNPERSRFLSFLPRLKSRRICILHKKLELVEARTQSPEDEGLQRFISSLARTLEDHLHMDVTLTTEWEGHGAELVICPEVSFDYLAAIRRDRVSAHRASRRAPVAIFVARDSLEAATLRSDERVSNRESVVKIMTQPCGPYKLAYVLDACLDRFAHPEENTVSPGNLSTPPAQNLLETQIREDPSTILKWLYIDDTLPRATPNTPLLSAAGTLSTAGSAANKVRPSLSEEEPIVSHILITDDNPLNRKLLVTFMRKQCLQYQEASNGLEALKAYQQDASKFEVILMDMSMPIMDGMSATRAIREFENELNLPRCSIIALTGLTSASARLEAWRSGIDHFMTKPVNFKMLGKLLKKEEERRVERVRAGKEDMGIVRDVQDLEVENEVALPKV
ncbi:uncharacterized protein ALTATR162_LOCUS94 [Alternaria atra]|uniref:Uncharacterized protein n=1 Tax=Alternaria atra TaxID=119953 RepID=A0A8J2HUT4_9PLEO|nr:uncharacterized protein ALTATR162_LOCUS94 [Alternaria atra]CAG5137411.1 unnamed protein product [Alternaria atra]